MVKVGGKQNKRKYTKKRKLFAEIGGLYTFGRNRENFAEIGGNIQHASLALGDGRPWLQAETTCHTRHQINPRHWTVQEAAEDVLIPRCIPRILLASELLCIIGLLCFACN